MLHGSIFGIISLAIHILTYKSTKTETSSDTSLRPRLLKMRHFLSKYLTLCACCRVQPTNRRDFDELSPARQSVCGGLGCLTATSRNYLQTTTSPLGLVLPRAHLSLNYDNYSAQCLGAPHRT